ncbi:MAG: hypothetical protein ACTHMJ_14315 [Thermomicrobiales bacterium]
MIPTPAQPPYRYGIGAVNDHTGETVVQFHCHKQRPALARLLGALLAKHPTGTVYVAWDNASTREDDEVEGSSAGRQSGWSCSICPPTVPGAIRLRCSGGTSAAR